MFPRARKSADSSRQSRTTRPPASPTAAEIKSDIAELSDRHLPDVDPSVKGGCVTLNALRAGTLAQVAGFAEPEHPVSRRLFDLGFAPGVPVKLTRRAPMRDPLVIEIAGAEMVLRGADASRVLVSCDAADDSSARIARAS